MSRGPGIHPINETRKINSRLFTGKTWFRLNSVALFNETNAVIIVQIHNAKTKSLIVLSKKSNFPIIIMVKHNNAIPIETRRFDSNPNIFVAMPALTEVTAACIVNIVNTFKMK